MDGFDADKWGKFTDVERIEFCRMAAREAETYAQLARPDLKRAYKDIAAQWHLLSAEIERP
jgi:hypothetical protein